MPKRIRLGVSIAVALLATILPVSCNRIPGAGRGDSAVLVCIPNPGDAHRRFSLQVSRLSNGAFTRTRQLLETENCISVPRLSPDGTHVAFAMSASPDCSDNNDIFVIPTSGGVPVNLTHHPARDSKPSWSPDGKRIAFYSSREPSGIYTMGSDGSNVARLPTGSTSYETDPAWSPDGTQIAFVSEVQVTLSPGRTTRLPEIFVVSVDGSYRRRVTDNLTEESMPTWSPDGKSLIFLRHWAPTLFPDLPTLEGYSIGGVELASGEEYLVREPPKGNSYEYLSWSETRHEVLATVASRDRMCQYLLPCCEACAPQVVSCEGLCLEADW